MALTYERVIKVISQKTEKRKDFEVQNLLSWFRKKSDLFKNLKSELLFDIIKNLHFVSKEKDEVIIQQGDYGDCMYILLRGQVTIFIQYTNRVHGGSYGNAESGGGTSGGAGQPTPHANRHAAGSRRQSSKVTQQQQQQQQQQQNSSSSPPSHVDQQLPPEEIGIRKLLGTYVCSLGQGSTFGEVSLISEDSVRTASIIADEHTDLIVVGRKLYNRSVKNVLQKEFQDKAEFIASSALFRNWAPKYRKQLAMALQKEVCEYEGVISRQGSPVTAIHFILSGEVTVSMDANLHKSQYERLKGFNKPTSPIRKGSLKSKNEDVLDELAMLRLRRKQSKKIQTEVCLLGVNECIGDTEVLLELNSYMQTVVCTMKTELLTLELKHYDRLLAKRNPKTVNLLKEHLEVKLVSRITPHIQKTIPLLSFLKNKVSEYNYHRRREILVRQVAKKQKNIEPRKPNANFLPARGALVDIFAPGTVFHLIRQREQSRALRVGRAQKRTLNSRSRLCSSQKNLRNLASLTGRQPASMARLTAAVTAASAHAQQIKNQNAANARNKLAANIVDRETSDPALQSLERRIAEWLNRGVATHCKTPRVVPLHRSKTAESMKKEQTKETILPPSRSIREKSCLHSRNLTFQSELLEPTPRQDDSRILTTRTTEENENVVYYGSAWDRNKSNKV